MLHFVKPLDQTVSAGMKLTVWGLEEGRQQSSPQAHHHNAEAEEERHREL